MVLKDLCVFVFLQREKTPIWGKNQRKHPDSVIFVDMQWWLKIQISYLKEQRFHNVSIKGNRSSASNLNILPRINQNDVNEPSFQDLADNVHIYFHVLCWYDKQLLVETYISSNLPTEGKHQAAVPGPRSLKGQERPKNNQEIIMLSGTSETISGSPNNQFDLFCSYLINDISSVSAVWCWAGIEGFSQATWARSDANTTLSEPKHCAERCQNQTTLNLVFCD